MSPAPARTSTAAIIAAGRAVLEADGLDAVTMATVAGHVGVRPASLYKHVRDRAALIEAVATDAADELGRVLANAAAVASGSPEARLALLADTYRGYARRAPRAAALLFADLASDTQPPLAAAARAAQPVIDVAAELAAPGQALAAARVLTAFAYGFTSMEAAGAFRLGGDVDDAFRLGVATLARGLRPGPEASNPSKSEAADVEGVTSAAGQ